MRVAIVSHMPWDDPYGAATSLRLTTEALRRHVPELELTIFAAPSRSSSVHAGRELCDSSTPNSAVVPANFPMEIVCSGFSQPAPVRRIWNRMVRRRSMEIVAEELATVAASSDLIHLNSMTLAWIAGALHEILGSDCPLITLHVRESALPGLSEHIKRDLSMIDGIVAIDDNVLERLCKELPNMSCPVIVLSNLSPQPATSQLDDFTDGLQNQVNNRPVVAVTGRVSLDKGIAFVARAIASVQEHSPVLLVVGARSRRKWLSPQSHLEIARAMRRLPTDSIFYLDEIPDLGARGFYGNIDVLIRGDARPGIGRNVYEALRSGASVIIPGTPNDYRSDAVLSAFTERVYFARVRNSASYASAISRALRDRNRRVDGEENAADVHFLDDAHHAEALVKFWEELSQVPRNK